MPGPERHQLAPLVLLAVGLIAHGGPAAAVQLTEVAVANDVATVVLPGTPTGGVIVRLYVEDADYSDEGTMTINGNPVVLFGPNGIPANNGILAWTTQSVPSAYWHAGSNLVQFSYTRQQDSYRVDLIQVQFQLAADMPVIQMLKAAGRAPQWLDEDDDVWIRLRRNPDRVYMCAREDGSPTGRRFLVWTPGDQVTPDLSQPLAPVDSCDIAICFADDDSTSTRVEKVAQACGTSG